MARMPRIVISGYPHHVTQRGNRRQTTFFCAEDYQYYLELMSEYTRQSGTEVWAYCLMPNHFHLLVYEKIDGGISIFMKKLSTAYSMYFNNKHNRSGALFEGRFKAKYINDDNYLKYLLSYIHLNPIKLIDPQWKENGISDKVRAKEYLKGYKYSSYIDFLGTNRKENNILTPESYPQYFATLKEFENFVDEWLTFDEKNL